MTDEGPRPTATDPIGEVIVHFDGACQPPRGGGTATYGFTIHGEGLDLEEGGLAVTPDSERSTNNVAEYVAAIRALETLASNSYRGPVILRGDSQLVIRQMEGSYRVRTPHLEPYHERLRQLAAQFSRVTFDWVPRTQNVRADALSKEALRRERQRSNRRRDADLPDDRWVAPRRD